MATGRAFGPICLWLVALGLRFLTEPPTWGAAHQDAIELAFEQALKGALRWAFSGALTCAFDGALN